MKIRYYLPALVVIFLTLFLQCSKDKNEKPSIDLKKGLLAYFKLDNEFTDSTGNIEIVGASAQGVIAVPDRWGHDDRAMLFNGGSMSAGVNDWSANPITVAAWVKPADLNNFTYFLSSNDATIGFVQMGGDAGFVVSIPATESAMTPFTGGWFHLTGTFDGKEIRTYLNGELVSTKAHPGEPDKITTITVALMNNVNWKGSLDDLRFYDRLLSKEEILALAKL